MIHIFNCQCLTKTLDRKPSSTRSVSDHRNVGNEGTVLTPVKHHDRESVPGWVTTTKTLNKTCCQGFKVTLDSEGQRK